MFDVAKTLRMYGREFREVFKRDLKDFLSKEDGFNLVAFDAFLNFNSEQETAVEAIGRIYGQNGRRIIDGIVKRDIEDMEIEADIFYATN